MTILFYAMIDNSKPDICLSLTHAFNFFKTFNLDHVSHYNEGSFTSYDSLCDKLEDIYRQVAESSISSEEEGSVLYFVRNYQQVDEYVLSMCKLKTLEYRVFRKLREKMRNFVAACRSGQGNNDANSKLKQFISETNELCEGFMLPHDLSVYQEIG